MLWPLNSAGSHAVAMSPMQVSSAKDGLDDLIKLDLIRDLHMRVQQQRPQ